MTGQISTSRLRKTEGKITSKNRDNRYLNRLQKTFDKDKSHSTRVRSQTLVTLPPSILTLPQIKTRKSLGTGERRTPSVPGMLNPLSIFPLPETKPSPKSRPGNNRKGPFGC